MSSGHGIEAETITGALVDSDPLARLDEAVAACHRVIIELSSVTASNRSAAAAQQ
jgi:hypothetical protein